MYMTQIYGGPALLGLFYCPESIVLNRRFGT